MWTSREQYNMIYGIVATLVVSLMSLAGAAILPFIKGKAKRRWFNFFIAMAVATLSSDALMHLLPHAMGLHKHDHGKAGNIPHTHSHDDHDHSHSGIVKSDNSSHNDDHGHGHSHEDPNIPSNETNEHNGNSSEHFHGAGEHERTLFEYTDERDKLCKVALSVLVVMLLYFGELTMFMKVKEHNHHHDRLEKPDTMETDRSDSEYKYSECESLLEKTSIQNVTFIRSSRSNSNTTITRHAEHEPHSAAITDAPIIFWGLRSTALVILFGDAIHNMIDGIAIGAAFSESVNGGLATTIAVVCHELPHELGDMAVLLESGLSMKKALFLNFVSALTAFIGLFLGLGAGSYDGLTQWLYAMTAGMFLYVAWIDMLSHLKHGSTVGEDSWWMTMSLQMLGFFCGFMIMFWIAWFEHEIEHTHFGDDGHGHSH